VGAAQDRAFEGASGGNLLDVTGDLIQSGVTPTASTT
jgi:hypothetical protein